jgi:hypothetical protein
MTAADPGALFILRAGCRPLQWPIGSGCRAGIYASNDGMRTWTPDGQLRTNAISDIEFGSDQPRLGRRNNWQRNLPGREHQSADLNSGAIGPIHWQLLAWSTPAKACQPDRAQSTQYQRRLSGRPVTRQPSGCLSYHRLRVTGRAAMGLADPPRSMSGRQKCWWIAATVPAGPFWPAPTSGCSAVCAGGTGPSTLGIILGGRFSTCRELQRDFGTRRGASSCCPARSSPGRVTRDAVPHDSAVTLSDGRVRCRRARPTTGLPLKTTEIYNVSTGLLIRVPIPHYFGFPRDTHGAPRSAGRRPRFCRRAYRRPQDFIIRR